MSNITKRIVAIATALTVAVWFVGPGLAQALTIEELEAQIAALLEQLASLQSELSELKGEEPTGECPCTFTRNLYPEMSGDDVKCLQEYLNDTGYTLADSGAGSPGNETTYFGPITRAAVKEWQDANDVEYGDYWGYFGPKSQTAYDATCEVVVPSECETDDDCPSGYTCEDEECVKEELPSEEYLEVTLATDTPASAGVPADAQFVPFLKFDLSAGLEDVEISTITITRTGLGSKDDFDKIWLQVGDTVVSNYKSVVSDQTAILNLSYYEIPAGETVTFTLIGDMSATAGNIDALAIDSADDIVSDADDVTGTFPIAGNPMEISNYAIATAVFAVKGVATTVDIGDEDVIVGEFSIAVSSTNLKDGLFTSIRLKQTGTGGKLAYLDNLALYKAGDLVSTETLTDGEYVTFVLGDGYELPRGKTRTFTVKGDLISGDDADIIAFTLKKAWDLVVLEEDSIYGADITTGAGVALRDYTLNAGKFSVAKDSSSPTNQEVGISAEGVIGLIAKMDLGQAAKVDGLDVYLHTDSALVGGTTNLTTTYGTATSTLINADIENVSLYVNDTFIDSIDDATDCSGTGVYSDYCYEYATEFELEDNDLIKIIFDVESTAVADNIYKFVFSNTHFDSPEYIASGESVASGDKSGTATGNTTTITGASITHTRNDGYSASQDFVAGAEHAKLLQWVTAANAASDVTIKTLTFDITALASDTEYTSFTNLTLEVGGEVIAGPKDLSDGAGSNDGIVTFESIDYVIPAGGQAVIGLYSNISDGASTSTTAMLITLDVSDATFYDAEGETLGSGYYGSDVTSATLDIVGGGTLSVTLGGDTPNNAILIAETTNQEVARFKLIAENGEINVTDIYLANDFDDDNTADSDADARISALELVVGGEVIDSRVPTSGAVQYDLGTADAITVPKDDDVTVVIRADLNPITDEGQTNKRLKFHLYRVEVSETGATNALSGGTIAGANTVEAKEMFITKTAPVVTAASVGTTVLTNGWNDIFAFNVVADTGGGALGIKKIIFDVTGAYGTSTTSISDLTTVIAEGASSGDTTGVKIYKAGTEQDATIDVSNNNKILVTFDTVQAIEASKTFTLKANMEGFLPEKANILQTNIDEGSTTYKAAEAWATTYSSGTTATFVWSDNSGTVDSLTDLHWMNDMYGSGLSTGFTTLSMP